MVWAVARLPGVNPAALGGWSPQNGIREIPPAKCQSHPIGDLDPFQHTFGIQDEAGLPGPLGSKNSDSSGKSQPHQQTDDFAAIDGFTDGPTLDEAICVNLNAGVPIPPGVSAARPPWIVLQRWPRFQCGRITPKQAQRSNEQPGPESPGCRFCKRQSSDSVK